MTKRSLSAALLFIRDLFRQFFADQGILNAAALTYTTLFAVVPLMTVTYSMLAAIPSFKGVGDLVQSWIFSNFVPSTGAEIQDYLQGFTTQARSLTGVGIAFLLVTSIMMIKNIEAALNRIWRVSEPRKGLSSFLLYWAVLSLGPLLIGLGLVLTSYLASLSFITSAASSWKSTLFLIFPPLLSTAAFTLLYAAVPNCRVPVRYAAVGGLTAAVAFELAKRGFALFVTSSPSYQLIYGAFAAVPLFLLWIYISWCIVLFGAELTRAITIYQAGLRARHEPHLFTLLAVLHKLWEAQQQGTPVEDTRLLQEVYALDQERWDRYSQLLTDGGLIRRTEQGEYLLSRDLHHFSLAQLQAILPWPLPDGIGHDQQSDWKGTLGARLESLAQERDRTLDLSLANLFSKRPD